MLNPRRRMGAGLAGSGQQCLTQPPAVHSDGRVDAADAGFVVVVVAASAAGAVSNTAFTFASVATSSGVLPAVFRMVGSARFTSTRRTILLSPDTAACSAASPTG